MGTSTDAILFYGYCWDDEDVRNPWETADGEEALENGDEDDDWETRYVAVSASRTISHRGSQRALRLGTRATN